MVGRLMWSSWMWRYFFFFFAIGAGGALLQQDLIALSEFQNATDSGGRLGWSRQLDPCSAWEGITCINITAPGNSSLVQQRVSRINLPGAGISGRIPSGVFPPLEELTVLSLRSNFLFGPLPIDLTKCTKLRSLALQKNRFSGPLTWDFEAWTGMVRVDLSYNELNGSLPESLEDVPRIRVLYLQNNSFTGRIPAVRLAGAEFSVANNSLTGEIPEALSGFPASSFDGNSQLCGAPLRVVCSSPASPTPAGREDPPAHLRNTGTKLSLGAILAIVIGDIALLGVLTTLFLLCYWHQQQKRSTQDHHRSSKPNSSEKTSSDDFTKTVDYSSSDQSGEPQAGTLVFLKTSKNRFSLDDMLRASAEMIGQGGLGTTYRALLEDGQIVAVKRIKKLELSSKEFEQRMAVFAELEHQNLLSPRAYFFSKSEKLVVSEFMPRGSLALHLHGEGKDCLSLDWSTRLKIALGAARGVAYLHETFGGQLGHGNIKASNVLLSNSLEARMADHCLIQMLPVDSAMSAGIPAYRAPEVMAVRKFTQQSDVYAFGVVLLELLTGRQPWRSNPRGEAVDLPRWVQSVVREEWTEEVFDQRILRFSEEEMVELLQVALMCVATLPGDRPKMRNVVKMIEEVRKWDGSPPSSEELRSLDS